MKIIRLISLLFGLTLTLTVQVYALPLLPFPTANDLAGPTFVQPFAGLQVVSETNGIGKTEPFFSDLPDNAFPGNVVVNILGNFQAFDPSGTPTPLNIVGVEVTEGGRTFTPAFGAFDFAGKSSVTFQDSFDFDQVTFGAGSAEVSAQSSSSPTLGFTFASGPTLAGLDIDRYFPSHTTCRSGLCA